MAVWLYQLSANVWNPDEYRREVWQNQAVQWDIGKIKPPQKGGAPKPGDRIVLFYAKTGNPEPGIYGWGIITYYGVDRRIEIRLTPPSDYLKMNPVWDKDVESVMDSIRSPMPVGTMWPVKPVDWAIVKAKVPSGPP